MGEYRAIYKCRLCGEVFEAHELKDIFESQTYCSSMCCQHSGGNFPYEFHICNNEDVGFADFVGCKKVEDENESSD